jgi:hypothetical protein
MNSAEALVDLTANFFEEKAQKNAGGGLVFSIMGRYWFSLVDQSQSAPPDFRRR